MAQPTVGSLLVASPLLGDPNFMRSVVYLLEHSDQGTLGIILNRPLPMTLDELWKDCPAEVAELRICAEGGPVERERGLLLHGHAGVPGSHQISDGVWIGGDPAVLHERVRELGELGMGPRLFLGHGGWGTEQLAAEIDTGSWLVRPGHPRLLLDPAPPEDLWRDLAGSSERPPDPSVN